MVADVLSRKSFVTLAHICIAYVPMLLDMKALGINLDYDGHGALLATFIVRSSLVEQIKKKYARQEVSQRGSKDYE